MRFIIITSFLFLLLTIPCSITLANTEPPQPPLQLQNNGPQQPAQVPQFDDIQDIRNPLLLPDRKNLLLPLGLACALLILALGVFLFLRRKKPLPPPPDPGEIALEELDAARAYMIESASLQYAEKISEILRRYIEKRFHILFTRQTTGEFFQKLMKDKKISSTPLLAHADKLKDCLERCDMAKFAHSSPAPLDMEQMESSVRSFVSTTASPTEQGEE